ncbi:MAG: 30S ribosomal protein S8 [Desulfurivibrionaceae bacterium]
MSMSDPLADMLSRIRNGIAAQHESIELPCSNIKKDIAKILKEEGYISDYSIIEDNKQNILSIHLKYDEENFKVINGIKRVSKPSCRIYVKANNIPRVLYGLGIAILSTSKGVVTDMQARKLGVGGEFICQVW